MSYRAYIIAFDPEHGTYTETEIMEGFATEQEAVDHARNRLPEVQQELAKLGENLLCSYRIRVARKVIQQLRQQQAVRQRSMMIDGAQTP
ncbi:TPA: hypothetical protein ACP5B9_001555 [Escherichia coli]